MPDQQQLFDVPEERPRVTWAQHRQLVKERIEQSKARISGSISNTGLEVEFPSGEKGLIVSVNREVGNEGPARVWTMSDRGRELWEGMANTGKYKTVGFVVWDEREDLTRYVKLEDVDWERGEGFTGFWTFRNGYEGAPFIEWLEWRCTQTTT